VPRYPTLTIHPYIIFYENAIPNEKLSHFILCTEFYDKNLRKMNGVKFGFTIIDILYILNFIQESKLFFFSMLQIINYEFSILQAIFLVK
jgi:hypothetical protein